MAASQAAPPLDGMDCRCSAAGKSAPSPRPAGRASACRAIAPLHQAVRVSGVFTRKLRPEMDRYLGDWARGTGMRSPDDLVALNTAHSDRAPCFGRDIFRAPTGTRGDLSEPEYRAVRRIDLLQCSARASFAARAGYSSMVVRGWWCGRGS